MPTLTPPPPVYTPDKREQKPRTPQGPGSGGRPPYLKRTGGGGDGDDEQRHRNSEPRPGDRLRRARPAIAFFLIGDALAFLTLISLFFSLKGTSHFESNQLVSSWRRIPIPPILWLNTAVLLLSSLTMECSRRSVFHEMDLMDEWLGLGRPAARKALPWLLATAALGMLFLAGQWTAWVQLGLRRGYEAAYQNAEASRSFFNLFTGFHAAHLLLGLAGLGACVGALLYSRRIETRQIWIDSMAWYWHCMGLFWVALFALLVWGQ